MRIKSKRATNRSCNNSCGCAQNETNVHSRNMRSELLNPDSSRMVNCCSLLTLPRNQMIWNKCRNPRIPAKQSAKRKLDAPTKTALIVDLHVFDVRHE